MCGIAGYFNKVSHDEPIGRILLTMLEALGRRGPDSAGLALFGATERRGEICWIKLPEDRAPDVGERELSERLAAVGRVIASERRGGLVRAIVVRSSTVQQFCERVEQGLGYEVVSLGHALELTKQVGAPDNLDTSFAVAAFRGSHGIGHTRLSTESKVDLSHSQPFWARGVPDLATVHNGHITNYDHLRRIFEQQGYRFFTHNDSEVIAVYLADKLAHGSTLEQAIVSSLDDFDGSFTYLAASPTELAYARDPFAFKPLITVETDRYIAIANEEIAIRAALSNDGVAHEPSGHVYRIWRLDAVGTPVAA